MRAHLHLGDCLEVLRTLPDNCIDAVVSDPPYGLSFMGKKWDYDVPAVEVWAECLRVLKPGGHLLAFAGTRTQHRMAVRIEDAGFEIRDMIAWVYGCLSEDTEVLVDGEWVHYSKATCGRLALCYDAAHGTYAWQPIQEVVEYEYADTAFRIQSDHTDQIVSRNHRCLVERGGGFAFVLAEALECEARVPVLEDVCGLLRAIPVPHEGAGGTQPLLRTVVRPRPEARAGSAVQSEGPAGAVCDVRSAGVEAGGVAAENSADLLLKAVQRGGASEGAGAACVEGACWVDSGQRCVGTREDDRPQESGLEGRCGLLQEARHVRSREVCALPTGLHVDGTEGRVCDGASPARGEGDRSLSLADGGGPSREPRSAGQSDRQSDAVRVQSGSQVVRGAQYTGTTVARVTPFHYTGKVWCLRVPTGAFVARRNGKVFVTGNSGFPKNLDVSKAIDKAGGDAKRWQGWGTCLKPAMEPITMARKPLDGTVAANVLKHGTGALNIDGCRVAPTGESRERIDEPSQDRRYTHSGGTDFAAKPGVSGGDPSGRFPANIVHDGSDEVLAMFPQADSARANGNPNNPKRGTNHTATSYGQGDGKVTHDYRDTGSAARFFYCAKANKKDRGEGNNHPTVKPTDLMRYLVRLVTPPGGVVLDPFMGSGSTGKACLREGFRFVGIERDPDYYAGAWSRLRRCGAFRVSARSA